MMNYSVHAKIAALKDLKTQYLKDRSIHIFGRKNIWRKHSYLSRLSFTTITIEILQRLEILKDSEFGNIEALKN